MFTTFDPRFTTFYRMKYRKFSTGFNSIVMHLPKSGIRDVMVRADMLRDQMSKSGIVENIVRLEVGQPNFSTPAHVINAAHDSLRRGDTKYIPNAGLWHLREAISEEYFMKKNLIPTVPEQIIVTPGSMVSLFSLLSLFLSSGDECLVPVPGFPNYTQIISLLRAQPIPYLCKSSAGFLPQISDLENLINPRTKCIIVCNPGNPSGAKFPKVLVQEIVMFAKKHDIFIISDGQLMKLSPKLIFIKINLTYRLYFH